MALTGQNANQRNEDEHDFKNTHLKKVGIFGYNPVADDYVRVKVSSGGVLAIDTGGDGTVAGLYAQKILTSGSYTYIAQAAPGTALTTAAWRVKRVEAVSADEKLITWADGNTDFDNVATDPTTLTYS